MEQHAGEFVVAEAQRMKLQTRARQLWAAVEFLVGRAVFGAGAWALLAAGVLAAAGLVVALGLATIFVLPAIVVAFLAVFAIALLVRLGSDAVREWLGGRPLRRSAAAAAVGVATAIAAATVWWLLRCRAIARRERARVAAHHGSEIPVSYRPLPDGPLATARVVGADPTTWRDMLYLVVVPAYAVAACSAVALAASGAIAFAVMPLTGAGGNLDWSHPTVWERLLAGTALLAVVPFLAYGLARIGTTMAATLLSTGESARMRAELDEQRLRRRLAVDAAEHERRRIERDLHDGAQQRLVALGMTLGLARQKLPGDPDAAAELVEEAHREAKMAHAELRDLARGIHPAILADRGLDAALSALLRRLPLPVSIIVAMPQRPSAAVESAAYFVVSEALTNVSRHAAATRATVSITQAGENLQVEISDDGVGDADPARGTGLNGLRERVAGLNGTLTVDSPAGGPTAIRAEIPCES